MNAKQAAAYKAVEAVHPGMTVGLGTGTTAYFAIEKLGALVREGLQIQAVASSVATEELAKNAGIRIVAFENVQRIDLYIDGADEADPHFNLIKGGGGALVREKILAYNSDVFVVIVDGSKRVQTLGAFPLPVEVVPFAAALTLRHLEAFGRAALRQKEGKTFTSDNGNFIVDVHTGVIENPVALNAVINTIPGVVESGLFDGTLVRRLIVGHANGRTDVLEP